VSELNYCNFLGVVFNFFIDRVVLNIKKLEVRIMREEKVLNDAVVCFLTKDFGSKILLAMKTDKIGKGCWNGYGGGIEIEETPEQAGLRELWEESGIRTYPFFMKKVAEVDFHNTKISGSTFVCKVHYFFVRSWFGEPESRPEENMVNPTWFFCEDLPYKEMMPADEDFLPFVFQGKKVRGRAFLGPYQKEKLAPTVIEFVDSF